jgi:hypothetical protein
MEQIKLGVFLTPQEHQAVREAAAKAGARSMTQWVADLIRATVKIKTRK